MSINLIIVDDEEEELRELKKISLLEPGWNIRFAKSGKEALELLGKSDYDMIISDMRMPGMDGAELLLKVKKKYPQIIRVIMSGPRDRTVLFSTTQVAHQFFTKPYDVANLRRKIAKTIFLRKHLNNDNLVKIITGLENLPSLPEVFLQLEQSLHSPNVSAHQVGKIIAKDISMTARILQFINSPFFGLQKKINDPIQAVTLLGINTIKSLALHLKVFSAFILPENQHFSIEELWIHSMRVANTARKLIQLKSNDHQMLDNANVAGILHDIGKLILCNVPNYYTDVHNIMKNESLSYAEAEYRVFGTSHAEVGAYLLAVWGIADEVVETVAFHHYPSKLDSRDFSVTSAVHLANALVQFVPYIDLQHLEDLDMETNLMDMVKICKKAF